MSKEFRIMPLGDSITVGYTDNPDWTHPFAFGYRSGLHRRLSAAGIPATFVGGSPEPFNNFSGDPTHGGSVHPEVDLRELAQDGHRGYGGKGIDWIREHVADWIREDRPDLMLLLIGINGIQAESPAKLNALVQTIFETDPDLRLTVAQLTPKNEFDPHLLELNRVIREELVPAYGQRGQRISTVDLYTPFLRDPNDPASIDPARLSNGINHPTNAMYDVMAEKWFREIQHMLST